MNPTLLAGIARAAASPGASAATPGAALLVATTDAGRNEDAVRMPCPGPVRFEATAVRVDASGVVERGMKGAMEP